MNVGGMAKGKMASLKDVRRMVTEGREKEVLSRGYVRMVPFLHSSPDCNGYHYMRVPVSGILPWGDCEGMVQRFRVVKVEVSYQVYARASCEVMGVCYRLNGSNGSEPEVVDGKFMNAVNAGRSIGSAMKNDDDEGDEDDDEVIGVDGLPMGHGNLGWRLMTVEESGMVGFGGSPFKIEENGGLRSVDGSLFGCGVSEKSALGEIVVGKRKQGKKYLAQMKGYRSHRTFSEGFYEVRQRQFRVERINAEVVSDLNGYNGGGGGFPVVLLLGVRSSVYGEASIAGYVGDVMVRVYYHGPY